MDSHLIYFRVIQNVSECLDVTVRYWRPEKKKNSSFGVGTNWGSNSGRGSRFSSSSKCSDRLLGYSVGTGRVATTAHRRLVPRLRACGAIPLLPLCGQGKINFIVTFILNALIHSVFYSLVRRIVLWQKGHTLY